MLLQRTFPCKTLFGYSPQDLFSNVSRTLANIFLFPDTCSSESTRTCSIFFCFYFITCCMMSLAAWIWDRPTCLNQEEVLPLLSHRPCNGETRLPKPWASCWTPVWRFYLPVSKFYQSLVIYKGRDAITCYKVSPTSHKLHQGRCFWEKKTLKKGVPEKTFTSW